MEGMFYLGFLTRISFQHLVALQVLIQRVHGYGLR